jgi:hypothetical protein
MELFPTHIAILNAKLPPGYKIDIVTKSDSRPVTITLETF